MKRIMLLAVACAALIAGGCGSDDEGGNGTTQPAAGDGLSRRPQGRDPVELDPADFTKRIDNPYLPWAPDGKPGRKWEYRSPDERVVVTVTSKKKTVAGIDALVVNDTVTDNNGDLVEVTDDWYAQDKEGNVWYLGEDVKDYKDGKVVSTGGSWEHGVDGAYAGIAMPAEPRPGLAYRQEYYEGEAEDRGKVLSLRESVTVPFGSFDNVLETEDTTPLEPDVIEHKYYAKRVGLVRSGGKEQLVSFARG
jgi:hypothetical protein